MTTYFLTYFSCNKGFVFYSDDGFWNVLGEILVFQCKQLLFCLLRILLTSSKKVQTSLFVIYNQVVCPY